MKRRREEVSEEEQAVIDTVFYIAGWILIALLVLFILLVKLTGKAPGQLIRPCVFHAATGYYCPGCGGTRAVQALLQGKILASLYDHPVVPYMAAVGGWFMISQTLTRLTRGRFKYSLHFHPAMLIILLVIVLANWIVKNAVLFFGGIAML